MSANPVPALDIQKAVHDAAFLRGTIITSYAQVEFLLGDIWPCCQSRPEYRDHVRQTFPYRLEDRLKTVKTLMTLPGPLTTHAPEMSSLIDEILLYEDIRHFMAHALVRISREADEGFMIEYRLHSTSKEGLRTGFLETTHLQLRDTAEQVIRYANSMLTLCKRMYLEVGLEPPPFAD